MALFGYIFNDAPQPWQIGFQDGATPIMEGIVELHDQILFYLIILPPPLIKALKEDQINNE